MANRTLALIRKMFNYALDELEIISVSPCLKIKAPAPENRPTMGANRRRNPYFLAWLGQ